MLRLSQVLLQLLARALHTHLQGRHPGPRQLGDLLVLEIFDVLEEKRLAVIGRETCDRPIDCVGPIQAIGLLGMRFVQGLRVAHERPAAARGARSRRAAAIHQDSVQPGAEACRIVATRQGTVGTHEAVLQRFLRVFTIADHVDGVASQAIAITGNQRAVGRGVAGPDPAHQLCVAWFHFVYTHRVSRHVTRESGRGAVTPRQTTRVFNATAPSAQHPRRFLTMSRVSLALLAVATIAVACYKDDVSTAGTSRRPMAKVLLTDDPFPFDSVQSVQVYIVSIAVSTHPDTGTS